MSNTKAIHTSNSADVGFAHRVQETLILRCLYGDLGEKACQHGVHVLGSFIFGRPSDRPTFDTTLQVAQRANVAFAQFVMLTPFPGTVDFARWEKNMQDDPERIVGIPVTRHWLIPPDRRPKLFSAHPTMSADEIRGRTQKVWDNFYSIKLIWQRASCVNTMRARLAFVLISKVYRQMYANTGIATDSARVAPLEPLGSMPRKAMPLTVCVAPDAGLAYSGLSPRPIDELVRIGS